TRVKVPRQSQSRSNSPQVVAVFGQAQTAPRTRLERTIGRSHATVWRKVDRWMVPSRTLCQASNSLSDCQSNVTVRRPRARTAPKNSKASLGADRRSREEARRANHWHGTGVGCEDVLASSVQGDRLAWKPPSSRSYRPLHVANQRGPTIRLLRVRRTARPP